MHDGRLWADLESFGHLSGVKKCIGSLDHDEVQRETGLGLVSIYSSILATAVWKDFIY